LRSSSAVRVAVLEGIRFILDNHRAHAVCKAHLPKLRNLLHDRVEKVRVSMCNLLLFVKTIREIKYSEVAPLDHLLARLSSDSAAVGRRITQLLLNSFFPYNKPAAEQVKRALTLLRFALSVTCKDTEYFLPATILPEQQAWNSTRALWSLSHWLPP
jgi:condensin-2 complex subunit G2